MANDNINFHAIDWLT